MATVRHYFYTYHEGAGFLPGRERTFEFAGSWRDRAVAATAGPLAAAILFYPADIRMLAVTQVAVAVEPKHQGYGRGDPASLEVTIKNVGTTPIFFYFLSLADIAQ